MTTPKATPKRSLVQRWRDASHAKQAHKFALMRIEADFYTTLLAQPGVQEMLARLEQDALNAARTHGRPYTLPHSTRLLAEIAEKQHSSSAYSILSLKSSDKEMNRVIAWIAGITVLWAVFFAR